MRISVEHIASENITGITTYNPNVWSSGTLIKKRTDIGSPFIGLLVGAVARPVEQSAAIPSIYPHVISWSPTVDWTFWADNATAAATRRIQAYTFDKTTSTFGWLGYITLTFPTATNHTIQSMKMTYDIYTVGNVGVTGTTVAGNSTLWVTNKMCAGCRIGFGSTDPTQITAWYYISAIGGESSITLTAPITSNLLPSTPYVIEDLRAIVVTRNATTTNGGVFVAKGLYIGLFSNGGTTIPAATTVDNIRAVYWIADASVETNITACGSGIDTKTDWSNQNLYVLDSPSAGNYKIYKYNVRKALTLTTGKDTTTLILATGTQPITGTASITNNGRLATLNHGPASGQQAFYFVTTSRIYCAKVSSITNGNPTFIDYTMTEIPPGGITTYAATNALACVEYADTIDRLIIMSSGAAGVRSYISQFNNIGAQMDSIFLVDDKQIDESTADSGTVPHPSILAVLQTPWCQNGVLYLAGVGTTQTVNIIHAIPLGADWQYASSTNQRLISPKFLTSNCNNFAKLYVNEILFLGSTNMGKSTDAYRVYFRTANIDTDAITGWVLLTNGYDLSGFNASSQGQAMLEFRCISEFCIPARIFSIGLVYNDNNTDSHYQPSANFSNVVTKTFAWRFSTAFGTTVPTLRIRLYNAVTGGLLLDDNSATPTSGLWQQSTNNGATWGTYTTADLTNNTTYISYTPTTFGDNINVQALLTLLSS